MIHKAKEVFQKLEIGILEVLVGFLMIIGLIGYFYILPADLDWIDHFVSFILFTFLFYKLNITSILFGKKDKKLNLIIVLSFYSIFFKDIIAFTIEAGFKFHVLKFIENINLFFQDNIVIVTLFTLYLGIVGLLFVSFNVVRNIKISHPSFLYAIAQDFSNKNKATKFIMAFAALLGFYFFAYNTILEWLEFTIDDPVILAGIIYFITKIVKHREKFHKDDFVFRIGEVSEGLYSKFISLFHYKHTLPLAISGLVILHALTDAGTFAYSYSVGNSNIYLERIQQSASYEDAFEKAGQELVIKHHEKPKTFMRLFADDNEKLGKDAFLSISLALVYIMNALSLILFLIIPVIAWAKIFSQKNFHIGRVFLPFIYSSLATYILLPAYGIFSIKSNLLQGVEIRTLSVLKSKSILGLFVHDKSSQILVAVLIVLFIGGIIHIISRNKSIRTELFALSLVAGMAFYAAYIGSFFISSAQHTLAAMLKFIISPHILIGVVMLILLILTIMFYIGGFLMFVYELIMEYHKKKWSEPIDEELVKIIKKINRIERKALKKTILTDKNKEKYV